MFPELDTPTPVVDLDRLEKNLDRMAAYAGQHHLSLRPHVKTHKAPAVGAEQIGRGATGLTCATPWELQVMSDVADDLLLAYPTVAKGTLACLGELPASVRVTVAADSPECIEALAAEAAQIGRPVGVFVELDTGMHRVGVGTPAAAVALASLVRSRPPLEYAGVCFYPGHLREAITAGSEGMAMLRRDLDAFLAALDEGGLTPPIVSGGSTPTAWQTHELPRVTEFRPGTYVYNDRSTAAIGGCAWDDCALTVLATVISTSVSGQAVLDAGTKALGREPIRGASGEGFGQLLEHPEVLVMRMWEEHGVVDLSSTRWRPRVGERVRIVPNHVCIVTHLFDRAYGVRQDSVERTWPIAARGRGPAVVV